MRLLSGLIGAILGVIVGGSATLLIVTLTAGGNAIAGGFGLIFFGPVGLIIGTIFGVVLALHTFRYVQKNKEDGAVRRKDTLLVSSLVLGAPILAACMLWSVKHFSDPPSDQQLLSNFQHHCLEFDQIAQMVQADKGLSRVDDDSTLPGDPQSIGVSADRIGKYRQMLSSAGVPGGFQTTENADEIDFYYWMTGSAVSSDTEKGYAYLKKPPTQLLDSLNQCQPDDHNGVSAYRHIQGNWYLFYEYLPG